MYDFVELWGNVLKIFPILNGDITEQLPPVEDTQYENIGRHLLHSGTMEPLLNIVSQEMRSRIRCHMVPGFWKYFHVEDDILNEPITNSGLVVEECTKNFSKFNEAVNGLYKEYQSLLLIRNRLKHLHDLCDDKNVNYPILWSDEDIIHFLRNSLLAQLPQNFCLLVDSFYSTHFNLFTKSIDKASKTMDSEVLIDLPCKGCNFNIEQCHCQQLTVLVNETNRKLCEMGLLDRIAGSSMTVLIKREIRKYINDTCLGIFDRSHLIQLELWLQDIIVVWLIKLFSGGKCTNINDLENLASLQGLKVKLTYFMYEKYAQSIISQFFSIIIDYPDSAPAIGDLKICMEKIDLRFHLTQSLRNSLEARILHPGVNTMDILTGYVAAIKAIRHLDSTGVILEMVTAPIKEYLRKRNDTVRRVVTGLTEDGPTDLSEELAKGETITGGKDSTFDELSNWENWEPDPFGFDPDVLRSNSSKIMRSADIISMVVDIYGSKELFMVEYRNLMAERLLAQLDFNAEREIRNLELLKIRFGESLLHSCEVMLKDVADSKRINLHIHGDGRNESQLFDISSLIVSAQFWPSFNKESLELPEEIQNEFNKFTKAYEAYKGNRTLNWRTVTGRVNIVIEIGDRTMEMTVPPTQAIIIYHFQHKSEWSLDDLSALIKVPPSALRRRIIFWQNCGLISEVRSGIFTLIEEESEKSQFVDISVTADADDEDLERAMASASDQREEELQVFWSYIVGMLTNLDSMPIDRIHQMLKLFASNSGGLEFTQDELKHFLQRKVREHKLLFSGGVYQLAK